MMIAMRLRLFRNATQRLRLLPKDLPVFCQPGDEEIIRGHGFEQHGTVSRQDLRARAAEAPESRLLIPEDGETLQFPTSS
jgi:glyoxylase-like metal-dependent hydrolase (beta-lactamase superfamily II)